MSSKKDANYKCSLSKETLEKAKKELNENPSTRLIEVKTLRERLEKTPGLIPRTDTKFLLAFLRGRKFEQERAYQNVINYYKIRGEDPEMFEDLKPSRLKHVWEDEYIEVLADRDNDGCKMVVLRIGRFNPDRYSMTDATRIMFLACRGLLDDEETQVNGMRMILDMADLTWKQTLHFTPGQAKRIFQILQDVLPIRLKALDYVREPTFFDLVFPIAKQFMKEKLLKRICLHGEKYDKLHAAVSPDALPSDLGGNVPKFDNKEWVDSFMSLDAYYEEDNKFGFVNMGLNSEQKVSKSGDAGMTGLGGTFKKLEI